METQYSESARKNGRYNQTDQYLHPLPPKRQNQPRSVTAPPNGGDSRLKKQMV
jgi:hypothetical protein